MKKNNKTQSISELLNSSTFNELMNSNKLNSIVKYSTIFSFWDDVVGKKFSKFTKPYALKSNKIYISAKSPVIIQELSLYKNKLIQKINTYSKPLGIEIKDIVFNYKNFLATNPIKNNEVEDKPIYIQSEELENLNIDKDGIIAIENSISNINFLNENQKNNLASKIVENQKAKKLQQL